MRILTGNKVPCRRQIGPSVKFARRTIASFHPQRPGRRAIVARIIRSLLQGRRDADREDDAGCDVKNVRWNITLLEKTLCEENKLTRGEIYRMRELSWWRVFTGTMVVEMIFDRWENRLFIRLIISNQTPVLKLISSESNKNIISRYSTVNTCVDDVASLRKLSVINMEFIAHSLND